jgi:RimJ/RimL family protein N-acetyltransferase
MYLETSRLVLREFRDDDFDALFEMDSRPESVRYEPQKGPDGMRAYLKNAAMAAFFEPCTHYRFAITIRPNNGVRGMIGLAANSDMTRSWEIGWMVPPG